MNKHYVGSIIVSSFEIRLIREGLLLLNRRLHRLRCVHDRAVELTKIRLMREGSVLLNRRLPLLLRSHDQAVELTKTYGLMAYERGLMTPPQAGCGIPTIGQANPAVCRSMSAVTPIIQTRVASVEVTIIRAPFIIAGTMAPFV